MAGIRTMVLEILRKTGCQNMKAQLEDFSDNFDELLKTLKAINFL